MAVVRYNTRTSDEHDKRSTVQAALRGLKKEGEHCTNQETLQLQQVDKLRSKRCGVSSCRLRGFKKEGEHCTNQETLQLQQVDKLRSKRCGVSSCRLRGIPHCVYKCSVRKSHERIVVVFFKLLNKSLLP